MLERHRYPPGVPCWIDTAQPDPEAAVPFYGNLFGWEFEDRMPADVPGHYFVARLRGRDVAAARSQTEGERSTPVWRTYVAVESADHAAVKAKEAGGTVLVEPMDVLDAGRMAVISDPFGAVLGLWQPNRHHGAQLVNEAGTWNWSDLNTRDLEGSKAFYGAVFGWEANTVDLGEFEGTMWRLPGYGDFLETLDPDLRRRHADFGAPEGFADCVGWMMRMTSDQFADDVPPHWSVTFTVDDADLVAARVAELGGTVLAPPFDAGVVRIAVLTDPQGAVFSVNKFGPQ